jgi:glycosyltransferase involved in cell wall biosynthesis
MPASYRALAIIPAFNEEATIARTLADLRVGFPDLDLLVVNDGSQDRTSERVRESGVALVVDLPVNLGIGGAVQTGFKYAARAGYDVAMQVDADGQHLGSEIPKILAPVVSGEADVAIGSRFIDGKGYRSTFTRRIGIWIFRLVNSLLLGQTITDNTSGFRAYNRRAIAFLADHYPLDYPEPEAVVLLGKNGFRLMEVPVLMQDRQGGASSINVRRAVYYMVKVLLAVLVNAFRAPVKWRGADS